MQPYKPLGMIQPLPKLKRNPAGGRYIPVNAIGAALRPLPSYTRGWHSWDTASDRVKLTMRDGKLMIETTKP